MAAVSDSITITCDLRLLDGAYSAVDFRVANLAPFVALKADAYLDRRKPKDAYDLVYVLRWWPGGPGAAAVAVAASPVATDPFLASAVSQVAGDFSEANRVGGRRLRKPRGDGWQWRRGGPGAQRSGACHSAVRWEAGSAESVARRGPPRWSPSLAGATVYVAIATPER